LREQELLIQIGHDDPLQPMPPRQRFLPMMMYVPPEEPADRTLRQSGCVNGHAGIPSAFSARPAQPMHRLAHGSVDDHIVQTLQETIKSREIRHACKPQHLTQFAVLAQSDLGFAKGPSSYRIRQRIARS
jgi:nitrate reductase beta subunit